MGEEKFTSLAILKPSPMKLRILLATLFCLAVYNAGAQVCAGNGNLMIFTNYDGGILNINVDQNIPNLKIGICSYEPVQVNISGAYVGNITQVLYAGYNSTQNNNHCNSNNLVTAINGVSPGIVNIETIPQATLQNNNGYPFIICAYQCDTMGNQGGCNTVDQVVHYISQYTGATMYAHYIQYGCWSGTYNVSAGGTCCITAPGLTPPPVPPVASFESDTNNVCAGSCISFLNTSSGGPFSSVLWTFQGAQTTTSTDENPINICYPAPGTYPVTLTVTNSGGSDTTTLSSFITIVNPAVTAQFSYSQISNYVVDFTNTSTGATDFVWVFPPDSTTSTDENPSYNFPSEGVYPVVLYATGPCSNGVDTVLVTVIKTALVENTLSKNISIYPNPASGTLFIKTPQAISYTVCDVVGKTILSGNANGLANIDVSSLSKGLYFIRITANGQQAVKRFIKE